MLFSKIGVMIMKQKLEIYIHIPFCKQKCAYCDFLSFSDYDKDYVPALIKEIKGVSLEGESRNQYVVQSIFIGGGTPSLLAVSEISSILDCVYQSFEVAPDAEITIEANPGTLTKEKLIGYRRAGINRLSMGLQTANEVELKKLGRIHTYEEFLSNYHLAREIGFANINVDLMSAIPGQTVASFHETLLKIVEINPEHISAYSLIIEEGTPFYHQYHANQLVLPDEESERQMYYDTKMILEQSGYQRYEISNYSKPGFACKHNCGYWERTDYIGFGLGAASLIKGKRFSNEVDRKRYLEAVEKDFINLHQNIQILTQTEQMEEFMFLGLRLIKGISKKEFRKQFGKTFEAVYAESSQKLISQGLLEIEGDHVRLSERGLDFSNQAMAEFLISS